MGFAMSYTAFTRLSAAACTALKIFRASDSVLVWSGTQANSAPFRAFRGRRSIGAGAFQNMFHV